MQHSLQPESKTIVESETEVPIDYFKDKLCLIFSPDISTIQMIEAMGCDHLSYLPNMREMLDEYLLAADFVLLTGGTDISPAIYGQSKGDYTDTADSDRDVLESMVIRKCIKLGVTVIGICRGSQLLSSVLGGRLIQHDINHFHSHNIMLENGKMLLNCNANHHQLIIPPSTSRILGTCPDTGVNEIIFHPAVGLSVQYHPEWHEPHDLPFKYFVRLVHDSLEDIL